MQVKSSVGMLKVFCQFLHGEGDFVRHLRKMGYVVEHVQSYIGALFATILLACLQHSPAVPLQLDNRQSPPLWAWFS